MIHSAIARSPAAAIFPDVPRPKSIAGIAAKPSNLRSLTLPSTKVGSFSSFSLKPRPLYLSPLITSKRREFEVGAYEGAAERSANVDPPKSSAAAGQKVKIGIYFATWWALNVVFNIYNKKVLNAFPYPWLTSNLSLACGALMMMVS